MSTDSLSAQRRKPTRSSLACLPCRSRHLKCDGKRPLCGRCTESAQQCHYAQSRRGGLDRAALAERRRRLAVSENGVSRAESPGFLPVVTQEGVVGVADLTSLESSNVDGGRVEDDALIESYYQNFHKFHPVALPRRHLIRLSNDPSRQLNFKPLLAVSRLIGHLCRSKEWSTPLQDAVEMALSETTQTDILVQCRLLYSIALFWHDYRTESKQQMDSAVQLALSLEMFRWEFAIEHGGGDAVLTESWRRTWWWLYVVDGYYAGTLGTLEFAVIGVDATAGLPCQEAEYESGDIPEPKTLQDFDTREFDFTNPSFSSFAYLIGAVRCAASAIRASPKIVGKADSMRVIQTADAIVDGWSLLLPDECKQVMTKTGEIDELLFQAHLVIHVSTIGLHRPLSDLRFNAVEHVSSCARDPPPETAKPELVNVHTARVLRSVEAQIRFLALPVRPFHHTPFTTCMISEGTLALLSACNFLLKEKELAIARDQIRMIIGCLKALAEIWPRTARNVHEIQIIARCVLGIGDKASTQTPESSEVPTLSDGNSQGVEDVGAFNNELLSAVGSLEGLCGWQDLNDLDAGLSWWVDER